LFSSRISGILYRIIFMSKIILKESNYRDISFETIPRYFEFRAYANRLPRLVRRFDRRDWPVHRSRYRKCDIAILEVGYGPVTDRDGAFESLGTPHRFSPFESESHAPGIVRGITRTIRRNTSAVCDRHRDSGGILYSGWAGRVRRAEDEADRNRLNFFFKMHRRASKARWMRDCQIRYDSVIIKFHI